MTSKTTLRWRTCRARYRRRKTAGRHTIPTPILARFRIVGAALAILALVTQTAINWQDPATADAPLTVEAVTSARTNAGTATTTAPDTTNPSNEDDFGATFGPCLLDTDSDGLWDCEEDANTDADNDPATTPGPDTDGDGTPNHLDSDDDDDTIPTASESADPNSDGDPRDAVDTDRDGQPDYLDHPTVPTTGTVNAEQKISDTQGGLTATLDDEDYFGVSVASIGDVNGDGTVDIAVGAHRDDDGGTDRGAVYVLLLNADGTVKAEQKISDTTGGLAATLDDGDWFGVSVASIGDVNGDGTVDIAVGAHRDDDGGADRGAVHVLFLNPDGTVKAEQKISDAQGGLTATLDDDDWFGRSVAGVGDLDGDGVPDAVVGASGDDDGGMDKGAVYALFLNPDGTVKTEQKVSNTTGGLTATLDTYDYFGVSAGGIGDVDGDGLPDVAVGATGDDDGGNGRGAVYVLFLNANGTVKGEQKISDTQGGLTATLDNNDLFGRSPAPAGDVDGDGTPDLAVGAENDGDGGNGRGAVYLLFLNPDGTVRAEHKISDTQGGLTAGLDDGDRFSSSVAGVGDLDGDGTIGLVVGTNGDDDGGAERGAVYILDLEADPCSVDSDLDGLWNCEEDADIDGDHDPATTPGPDTDGDGTPNYLDPDDDGDTTPTASENPDPNGDGDPRDALDSDLDGQPDWLDAPTMASAPTVASEQKISDTEGGLAAVLDDSDWFGMSVGSVGDLDGDLVNDLMVGAFQDDDGGTDRGAVYVLFMNPDGTVKAEQKISDTEGGLVAVLDDGDQLGISVAGLGDLDGDGIPDAAVGAFQDDDGGTDRGALYVLFMNSDGTVKSEQKISDTEGEFATTLDDGDWFGGSVTGLSDLDGDGIPDLAVGARQDDDGGAGRGAVYVLLMNPDGTVKAEQKISDTEGGLAATLDNWDYFGLPVEGLGDLDSDGTPDMAVGVHGDDDGGGNYRGAVYILFLNPDGTVKAEQKISDTTGGLVTTLDPYDFFGVGIAGLGDVDGDGVVDIAVAAHGDSDGGHNRGAVYVVFLDADGTVKGEQKISDTTGGFAAALDNGDMIGYFLAGIGDLDGDGSIGLAVGSYGDDDGGTDRGAVHLLNLGCGDADGDGLCRATELPLGDTDGDGAPNHLDSDDDDDDTPTASENPDPNGDGDGRDALDSDRDGQPDHLDAPTIPTGGNVATEQKISDTEGGLTATLDDYDNFGSAATSVGDVDGDGVPDVAVGAYRDDDGGNDRGAVHLLFLHPDGTVKAEQKISDTAGGFVTALDDGDWFGTAVAGVGDIDGDGVPDLVVGAEGDDDGGTNRGAAYVLFLNRDGTVKTERKISNTSGGLAAVLDDGDGFGYSLAATGDVDGDGIPDVAVGAPYDDDGGTSRGAVYIVFLNFDGTVKAEQKISDTQGGFSAILDDVDWLSDRLAGVGDVDEDGTPDLVVGTSGDDDGGTNRGAIHVLFLDPDGTVKAEQKISSTTGGLTSSLANNNYFGVGLGPVGDVDGDGTPDVAVHAFDDDGGSDRGSIHLLFLDPDGTVKAERKISDTRGGLAATLDNWDYFGISVAGVGDLDGDGTIGLIVGANGDDDGGYDRGAVYILDLIPDPCSLDSDSDGLRDCEEDADNDGDHDPATNPGPDTDSDGTANYLDSDDDGDSIPTASENPDPNGDGDPRDAADLDRDGQPDWLDSPTVPSAGMVAFEQKISVTQGGLAADLDDNDLFGRAAVSIGDLDGDGVNDLAVGAHGDDDGGSERGAVYVLFMNPDGTVRTEQKISDTEGGLAATLDDGDEFGLAVAGPGDLDGDGVPDLAVGARRDDDGGTDRGAVYVLFLNSDGTVAAEQKISDNEGGLAAALDNSDWFGGSVTGLGDVDGDGIRDIAVGARQDDDGGTDRGAAYVLFLNHDGTVKAEQKISDAEGRLAAALDNWDYLAEPVAGLGDLDGDGVPDMALGAHGDDDGGSYRGAVHVLFLNADGTVKTEQKISNTEGGLAAALDDYDFFGVGIAGLGDIDGDGIFDMAVGAHGDDDGGTERGAVYVLTLDSDGTVATEQKISDTQGGLEADLDDVDMIGHFVSGIGDLDGDGTIGLALGVYLDDDGGLNRGAVYLLDLTALSPPVAVDDTATVSRNGAVVIDVLDNDSDPDDDPIRLVAITQPANGSSTDNGDGTVTYTLATDWYGTDTFSYTISDGTFTATGAVTVTVTAGNTPPTAFDDEVTTPEDAVVTIDALANDVDADGHTLSITSLTQPLNGVSVLDDAGTITYTPDSNWHGTDAFTYTVTDGLATDTAIISVAVTPQNDAPIAMDDSVATREDTAVVIDVLANDVDPEGDHLSVASTSRPTTGSITVEADNTITYTPAIGHDGSDTFTYTVTDGLATDTATVTVVIGSTNSPPVANPDTHTTPEDVASAIDALANDTDPDSDILTVTGVTNGTNGIAALGEDGTITYTPNADWHGIDSIIYTITDGTHTRSTTVAITVSPINDAPVAADDAVTTPENTPVRVDPLENDTDPDRDPLSLVSTSRPANGTITIGDDQTITYTPDVAWTGTETLTYIVTDGALSHGASIAITTTPIGERPTTDSTATPEGRSNDSAAPSAPASPATDPAGARGTKDFSAVASGVAVATVIAIALIVAGLLWGRRCRWFLLGRDEDEEEDEATTPTETG